MNRFDDISRLVDRFLDGDTTVAEEKRLDDFFAAHEDELPTMPEHLRIAAEMFREFRAMRSPVSVPKRPRAHWLKWAGAAAAAACILICVLFFKPDSVSIESESTTPLAESVQDSDLPPSTDTLTVTIEVPKKMAENRPNKKLQKAAAPSREESVSVTDEAMDANLSERVDRSLSCLRPLPPDMLPMHSESMTHAVVMECEMALLEEEFQRTERQRKTIKI